MPPIDRVKSILLSPRDEWPRIEAEPATVGGIVRDWLGWPPAIPPCPRLLRVYDIEATFDIRDGIHGGI